MRPRTKVRLMAAVDAVATGVLAVAFVALVIMSSGVCAAVLKSVGAP